MQHIVIQVKMHYVAHSSLYFNVKPISGRVDGASATELVDSVLILGWVKPKIIKLGIQVFTAFLLDVQQLKGHCEASAMCGRQVGTGEVAA